MGMPYRDALRLLSQRLLNTSSSAFGHPSAKGDRKEDLLQKFLLPRLGASFDGKKGEIVDSDGESTGEFDVVVYDRRVGSCIEQDSDRHLVRAESVAAILEVKSYLEGRDLDEAFGSGCKKLVRLSRYYEPTALLKFIMVGDKAKFEAATQNMKAGVRALSSFESVPAVVGFYVGFDGISKEAASTYLLRPGIDVVSVIGKYTIAKRGLGFATNPTEPLLWGEGDDSLAALAFLLEKAQNEYLDAWKFVDAHWRRYFWAPKPLPPEVAKPIAQGA